MLFFSAQTKEKKSIITPQGENWTKKKKVKRVKRIENQHDGIVGGRCMGMEKRKKALLISLLGKRKVGATDRESGPKL